MCLITFSPEGPAKLDWVNLDYSRDQNSDGFGIAWFADGDWQFVKSLRSHRLRATIERFVPSDAPLIIHQRFTTHGATNMANVHPFKIGKTDALMFHNGIIGNTRADGVRTFNKALGKTVTEYPEINDTRAYIEDELAPWVNAGGPRILEDSHVQRLIEERIGYGSVLAIAIPKNPEPLLLNDYRGLWERGVFYSNTYSLPRGEVVSFGYGSAKTRERASEGDGWSYEEWARQTYGSRSLNDADPETMTDEEIAEMEDEAWQEEQDRLDARAEVEEAAAVRRIRRSTEEKPARMAGGIR